MDDKELLLEVLLEESKACYYLTNLSKARVSLTSARTIANSIYIPPAVQAAVSSSIYTLFNSPQVDMQSGILYAADERDFQTSYSYFYEAFEGFDMANKHAEATMALKYMLLCKVMLDTPDEVQHIISYKNSMKYLGDDTSAIMAIAKAYKNRSLKEFNEICVFESDTRYCFVLGFRVLPQGIASGSDHQKAFFHAERHYVGERTSTSDRAILLCTNWTHC